MWADNETSEDLLGFKVHADYNTPQILDIEFRQNRLNLQDNEQKGKTQF